MVEDRKPARKSWIVLGVILLLVVLFVLLPHNLWEGIGNAIRDAFIRMHTAPRQ